MYQLTNSCQVTSHSVQSGARNMDSTDPHKVHSLSEANTFLYSATVFERMKRPQRETFHSHLMTSYLIRRTSNAFSSPWTLLWRGILRKNSQISVTVGVNSGLLRHTTSILFHLLSTAPQHGGRAKNLSLRSKFEVINDHTKQSLTLCSTTTWWPCEESLVWDQNSKWYGEHMKQSLTVCSTTTWWWETTDKTKTNTRIAGHLAKIRTRYHPNMCPVQHQCRNDRLIYLNPGTSYIHLTVSPWGSAWC